ncbi:MAG: TRAP transporter substrate-binding protein [Oscillospiraceae bacterium]|nr:TRAP transporter substrate-binding protein [Oscillospiraceae bacterium]
MKTTMKKVGCLLLALTMICALLACGAKTSTSATTTTAASTEAATTAASTEAATTAAATTAASGETYTISIAHNQTPDAGYGIGVAKLKELLAEKDPRIQLDVYDNGTLGNERDVIEGNQLGTVDVAITSIGVVSNFAPLAGVINLPFMFSGFDAVEAALNNEAMDTVWNQIETGAGLKVLGVYSQGFRHVVSNKSLITSLDDFKGLKIRVPEADLYVNTFKALGASPTPIAWGEMYTSMQTNVVDAFENTPVNVVQYNLQEVSKYETATNHIWDGAIITMNMDSWGKLPADVQQTFLECVQESATYQRQQINTAATDAVAAIKASGMQYGEVSEELHAQLVESVSSVYDDFYAKYPEAKTLAEALK